MSNVEVRPTETVCTTNAPSGPWAIDVLESREVPLGGLRAINVRRTLPQRQRSLIGAWCFLDHYGPHDVAAMGPMNVAAHPHTGLQTASWLFSGEIEHRDSAGFHAMVRPGELNLMTAGFGISHSERSTPETAILHGAQLWIALPETSRDGAAGFEHYAPPLRTGDGWRAQVFLGTLLGETSPVQPHTPLLGVEINIDSGGVLELDAEGGFDPSFEHGVLVDSGEITLEGMGMGIGMGIGEPAGSNGPPADPGVEPINVEQNHVEQNHVEQGVEATRVPKDALAYAPVGAIGLRLTAGTDGARVLLLGGEPFGEQIVMWWNFIGRSHEEIVQARLAWQHRIAESGVGDPSGLADPSAAADRSKSAQDEIPANVTRRFSLPAEEPEPPLPAPALPVARLVPRRQ